MPNLPLTDLSVRSLKSEARTDFWDTKIPSFGVRVGARSKTFIAKVNNRRITIGQYPATTAVRGPDIVLSTAIDLFLAQHCEGYRPRSLAEITRLLGKLSPFSNKKLTAITTQQVHELVDALPTSEANHLFKAARTLFRFCVRRRLGPNPIEGLSVPNKERSRARVLSDEELAKVWKACEQSRGGCAVRSPPETMDSSAARLVEHPRLPASYCAIVKLLILTGQRRGEIAALQSSWIKDYKITLPKEIAKNGREHIIPLSSLSASLVASLPLTDQKFVFPARGKTDSPFPPCQ
jgi:integrase